MTKNTFIRFGLLVAAILIVLPVNTSGKHLSCNRTNSVLVATFSGSPLPAPTPPPATLSVLAASGSPLPAPVPPPAALGILAASGSPLPAPVPPPAAYTA